MGLLRNIVGKGENIGKHHFLVFQHYFLPIPKRISVFGRHLFCHLQILCIWTSLKNCRLVELSHFLLFHTVMRQEWFLLQWLSSSLKKTWLSQGSNKILMNTYPVGSDKAAWGMPRETVAAVEGSATAVYVVITGVDEGRVAGAGPVTVSHWPFSRPPAGSAVGG